LMAKRITGTTERHGLELREGHWGQYSGSTVAAWREVSNRSGSTPANFRCFGDIP